MGFRIREVMEGTHEFRDGRDDARARPFAFKLTWGPDRLREWLDPTSERCLWQEAHGELRADGLCDWTPCQGTLELQYARRRRVRYTLDFEADGLAYRFVGDKVDIRPWNLAVSHTTCYGTLTALGSGKLISTSVTRFHLAQLPRFLASVRWA